MNFTNSKTQFKKINGNDLAYRQFGSGIPIILYNRFRGIMDTWDPLFLDTLSEKHEVVVFDYPGIGSSQGELSGNIQDVANSGVQLMESLGHKKFHVGGWSYGGSIAQISMFINQDKVLKAVLMGTNPPGENAVPFESIFFKTALKATYTLDDETILFFEPKSEMSKQAAKESRERIAPRLDQSLVPSKKEVIQRFFEGGTAFREDKENFREMYKTLKTPVLIISGDHDISFATENWFPLLKNAPSIQNIIFNDAGHGPQHQYPVLVAGYIQLFLAQGSTIYG